MQTSKIADSDRTALRMVRAIPDGDYNREVEIEARADGLWIDEYITVPWEWILQAASVLHVHKMPQETDQRRCSLENSSPGS